MAAVIAADDVTTRLNVLSLDTNSQHSSAHTSVAGYEDVQQALRELIAWPQLYKQEAAQLGIIWPRGLLLHGPSGCGKSLLVRHIASACNAILHTITAATITGALIGESEQRLRDAFAAAQEDAAAGRTAVVFLDELDTLAPRRAAVGGGVEARVVGQLLTLIDQVVLAGQSTTPAHAAPTPPPQHVVVIGATSNPSVVDPALRRPGRLDRELLVNVPTLHDRTAMLTAMLSRCSFLDSSGIVHLAGYIAAQTAGHTGADLDALVREAAMNAAAAQADTEKLVPDTHQVVLKESHIQAALQVVRPSLARGAAVEVAPVAWSDLGGISTIQTALQHAIEWPLLHAPAFARLGLIAPRGVLLYGPPGCSKTSLVRAVATSCRCPLIPLSAAALYSMYVGEGEALLRARFQQARQTAPSIVFLDELDALAGKRGGQASSASVRLLTALLVEMDGLESAQGVWVLGATNRPWALDAALLRPGRFDVQLYVPPPDGPGRVEILQLACRHVPLGEDVHLQAVGDKAEHMTGADLKALVREAAFLALREDVKGASAVHARHFKAALANMQPSVLPSVLEQYTTWTAARQRGRGQPTV